jgi:hypothetical protein
MTSKKKLDQDTILERAYEHYVKTFARENGESEEVFKERMMRQAKEYTRGRMDAEKYSVNTDEVSEETTEVIGYVGIDSGMIAFGDPVYIDRVVNEDEIEKHVAGIMGDGHTLHNAVVDKSTQMENAIYGALVSTGIGDGFYPVLVTTVDLGEWGKRISRLEIVFLPDDED